MARQMSRGELLELPVSVDVPTAGRALGIGRDASYDLVRRGEFPCRVVRAGRRVVVPRAELLRVLGLSEDSGAGAA